MLNTALNVSEAARLYRLLGPRHVIASGGMPPGGAGKRPESEVMREYLVRLGVAAEDIALESASINTTEQAEQVAALLPRGARVLLVTAPAHMPRAAALFRSRGLDVVPAVSGSLPDTRTHVDRRTRAEPVRAARQRDRRLRADRVCLLPAPRRHRRVDDARPDVVLDIRPTPGQQSTA